MKIRSIAAATVASALAFLSLTVQAVPDFWKKSAYAVECNNNDIEDVLEDFASSFGVQLVSEGSLGGECKGWRRADSAVSFLNQISTEYRVQWFVYKGNLYVSPNSDSQTRRLSVGSDFKKTLQGLGLFQEKFGWGGLPGDNAVIVTGPRQYIELINRLTYKQSSVKKREVSGNVHIFKLKHAPVEDRKIVIRDETVVIPGVATILKGLLGSRDTTPKTVNVTRDSFNEPSNLSKFSESKGITVEADVRTNSILIRAPEKDYPFYRDIIDSLDIESFLIEIDAIIVDINRDRLREIGTNFSFTDSEGRGSINTNTTINGGPSTTPINANATILIKDLGLFYTNLKALENDGDASIIANTSILTLENQPAVIDLSETVFIQSLGERVVDVRPVTAGTLLNVTPMSVKTDEGDKIKLAVDIEDGKLSTISADSDIPRIQKTTISTKAIITQNRSLVIGGYHVQKSIREDSGIPGLKKIPAVGNLFKNKLTRDSHLERLFILTPRISPTYHNPEDYSSTGSDGLITEAVSRIKRRWKRASQSYVEKTQHLLAELASGNVPKGYRFDMSRKIPESFVCAQNGVDFNFSRSQEVKGHGLTAYIGLVTNTRTRPQRVEESACSGKGLIGVSIYPKTVLGVGESAEVFVSLESARMSQTSRPTISAR